MAERRAVSLLDCAIAASGAIVPVLLGVVALVAFVRPGDPDSFWRQGHSDRYVSVRHVAALQTFERAIVRRTAQEPRLVNQYEVLDARVRSHAEAQQGGVELVDLRCDPRRDGRIVVTDDELAQRMQRAGIAAPFAPARRQSIEQRARRQWRRRGRGPAHDGLLERLQRGDVADTDVAVTASLAPEAVGVGRADECDQRDDAEQDRNDDRARRDRALEQRDRTPLSHGDLATARRR